MKTPLPELDGRTPWQAIEQGDAGPVLAALAADYEGLGFWMPFEGFLRPWSGTLFRHVPADRSADPLDFRFAGVGLTNRWHLPGQPTLCLASDEGVMIAGWGRHHAMDRSPELELRAVERAVFRFDLALDRVIDLQDPDVTDRLQLSGAPGCFADIALARATANFFRHATAAQAVQAASMAFPDDPSRFVMARFLEKLPDDPRRYLRAVTPAGTLRRG
ncbi:MAG: RES domain-containing protein [Chloroflexota bacterium]